MKKCLLCGDIDKVGDAATCPNDGEATWESLDVPGTAVIDEPAPDAPMPSKRSRK